MKLNRQSYVIFYQGKHVVRKLETLAVNIVYVSRRQSYAVFYTDKDQEQAIKKQLRKTKGFRNLSPSPAFNEELNILDNKDLINELDLQAKQKLLSSEEELENLEEVND